MRTLEQRVDTLEKGLRRWRAAAIALAVLIFGAVSFAAKEDAPKVADLVRTRRLEVVDKDGRVVTEMHEIGGVPFIEVMDDKGHPRIALTIAGGGGFAEFTGEERAILIHGSARNGREPSIEIQEEPGGHNLKTLWKVP